MLICSNSVPAQIFRIYASLGLVCSSYVDATCIFSLEVHNGLSSTCELGFVGGPESCNDCAENLASLRDNTDSDVEAPFMVLPAEALLHG